MPILLRHPVASILARAAGAIAVTYAALHVVVPAVIGVNVIAQVNLVLATASATLMNAIGVPVVQAQTFLTFRGATVVVTDDCNGLGAWLLVVGAMFALPSIAWRWRLLGVAMAALAISAVNITRIAILCVLQAERPAWFSPFHEQIAPLAVVLTASACFALWLQRVNASPQR